MAEHRDRLKSKCVAIVAFPVVAFAEPHGSGHSGAIINFNGFEVFEEKSLQVGDLSVEVFTRAQKQARDERFEEPCADISIGLAKGLAMGVDLMNLCLHGLMKGRKQVVNDERGINVLPGIIDGDGRKTSKLQQAFEREKTGFHAPSKAIKSAKISPRIFLLIGKRGEQYFGFAGRQFKPNQTILKCCAGIIGNTQGFECAFGSDIKYFTYNGLSLF